MKYLKPSELSSRWCGFSIRTLANWRTQKTGPAYIRVGSRVLYPLDEIETYERKRNITPKGE